MPPPRSPRPQLKQTRSTGWAWPHLVDMPEQKDKANQAKRKNAAPEHVSAPSLQNLWKSHDLSALREEDSAPASPTYSPESPRGSISGHRAEASEHANAIDDEQKHVNDASLQDLPSSEDSVHKPETQSDKHVENVANDEPQDVPLPKESEAQDDEHSERIANDGTKGDGENAKYSDENLPGAFPLTPVAVAVASQDDRYFALNQTGLSSETVEPNNIPPLEDRFPGLNQAGLLPAAVEAESTVPESISEEHAVVTKDSPELSDANRRVSTSEPDKPLPPPRIMIQRPSKSDLSENDDHEFPGQSPPTPDPRTIDSVLTDIRRGTESLPLQERLEEERRITSELTQQDRERIIQDIAKNIAADSLCPVEAREVKLPINIKVKKRTKFRRAVVRGPMLKILLGKQLAGPTKEVLKLRALGKALPVERLPAVLDAAAADVLPRP